MSSTRARRTATQDLSCPICLTTFHRATTSISEYNNHVNRCSEAQFQFAVKQSALPASPNNNMKIVQKLGIKQKGAASASEKEEGKSRSESLRVLEEGGPLRNTFKSLLLQHLGE